MNLRFGKVKKKFLKWNFVEYICSNAFFFIYSEKNIVVLEKRKVFGARKQNCRVRGVHSQWKNKFGWLVDFNPYKKNIWLVSISNSHPKQYFVGDIA